MIWARGCFFLADWVWGRGSTLIVTLNSDFFFAVFFFFFNSVPVMALFLIWV